VRRPCRVCGIESRVICRHRSAAEPDSLSAVGWRVNTWVKQGILLGFSLATSSTCRWITQAPFYDGHAAAEEAGIGRWRAHRS
jgi:hypothetical protein